MSLVNSNDFTGFLCISTSYSEALHCVCVCVSVSYNHCFILSLFLLLMQFHIVYSVGGLHQLKHKTGWIFAIHIAYMRTGRHFWMSLIYFILFHFAFFCFFFLLFVAVCCFVLKKIHFCFAFSHFSFTHLGFAICRILYWNSFSYIFDFLFISDCILTRFRFVNTLLKTNDANQTVYGWSNKHIYTNTNTHKY